MRPLAICLLLVPAITGAKEPPPLRTIDGIWEGPLVIGPVRLRLAAKIKQGEAGALSATVDSIDQNAKDIPVATVTWKDPDLRLDLPRINSVFTGAMTGNGMEISGHWKQNGIETPLTLKRVDKTSELRRPQEPKRPYPYDPIEVTVENKAAGVMLAGTLTRPQGAGPFPAVVMITGSGGQDRDESLMGHKPFWVIADALTRRGIAVLRVDDRGVGKSTGNANAGTTADFATDTAACVSFLKTRSEIDAKRIGLIGHSEGGVIAAMVASSSKDVAFAVLLAGSALPGEDIVLMQSSLISRAAGKADDHIAKNRADMAKAFAVVKAEKDDAAATQKLRALWEAMPESERKQPGNTEADFKRQVHMLLSPWFRYFLTLDPRTYLQKVKVPVLALNGALDLQVPPKENLAAIAAALKSAKNSDVTTRELPGLNHLFQTAKTGAPSEYVAIEETFAPAALQIIGDWIVARTTRK
jgi:uncharacterized protein